MKTMDTPRRDVAGGASVDSASKKLRQALLPFQVISPVGVSSASKKRKINDDTDAKVSKNLRIEKTPPEFDLTEAKENVNLEVKKSETLCHSSASSPNKEKSAGTVEEDDEVMCLTLDSPEKEPDENTCNKSANEDEVLVEPLKKCISEEPEENAADVAIDTESTASKEDGSCNSDKSDGNKSIETESDSDLDKTGENADSSINVSIGDSDRKVSLSGSEEMSEMNTSAASLTSTPKQQASLQKKKLLSLKQKEQREKVRQELERKKEEKRKEKEEKLLQKKKEKEEEMKRRLSQKLEEKQKKEEERQQKKKQKEEERLKKEEEKLKKEEEKQKEKNRKEEEKQKKEEEKQKKEEEKQKERQKREEEKKKLEEEEQRKKKAAAAFASFFVPKKSTSLKAQEEEQVTVEAFMPFRVKGDMRLAPVVRRILSKEDKKEIESKIADQSARRLYLTELREKSRTPMTHPETWPKSELKDDVVILEDEEDVPTSEDRLVLDPHHDEHFRAKLLQFCENRRPPYWGTWRKKSSKVGPRNPFYKDEKYFDYEVDSDDEWEEEEPGESLHGSDDEKESEDEYEVDNEFFVPHGYLSDEEAAAQDADDEVVSPETQKAKLKLLGLEFEEEMKQKTKQIKPQLIGCYWINETMDEHLSHQYEKIFSQFKAVTSLEVIPTSFTEVPHTPLATATEGNQVSVGRKKKIFPEEAMPDLIKLLHGNRNSLKFLALEFYAHLSKGDQEEERPPGESPLASSYKFSKGSIAKKIREIASWKLCTDEGPSYGKNYWFVSDSVRAQYDLTDLPQANHWKYNLKPKKQGKVKAEASTVDGSQTSKLVEVGDEFSPTHPKKPHLITKFTKVISKEERLKQLNQMAQSNADVITCKANESIAVGKPSHTKSNQKCNAKSEKTTPVVSGELKVKKRVPLLVSVPRGQEIPKSYSLPSFLKQSPTAGKQQTNSKGLTNAKEKIPDSSDNLKVAAKEDSEVITLD